MNLKKTLGAAAIIATAAMPHASAKEMGAPELFWIFFSLAVQHAFSPARADSLATPAQGEAAVCDALQGGRPAFRKSALDTPGAGAFCLRQDYVFECAPYGCGDAVTDVRASDGGVDADIPRPRGGSADAGRAPVLTPARESAP